MMKTITKVLLGMFAAVFGLFILLLVLDYTVVSDYSIYVILFGIVVLAQYYQDRKDRR